MRLFSLKAGQAGIEAIAAFANTLADGQTSHSGGNLRGNISGPKNFANPA